MTGPDAVTTAPNASSEGASSDEGSESSRSSSGVFGAIRGLVVPFLRSKAPEPLPSASASQRHDQQRQLYANVERLDSMRVSDAMVPRADIVAVDVSATLDEVVEAFRSEGHSRLPVYQETLDDALGFVHVKDIFMATGIAGEMPDRSNFSARRYLRRFLTVPPSMLCGVLLQKMQAERVHMALVIDEYGGVDGIVTIEDLLELIVGDIEDEHDTASESGWSKQDDGAYHIDARTYLEDFEKETRIPLLGPDKLDDVDTLGGLVFMLCNRVPARGEVIRHPDGHEFEILDADPRRIKRLLVTLSRPASSSDDSGSTTQLEAAQ